jgi:hypothetical protein
MVEPERVMETPQPDDDWSILNEIITKEIHEVYLKKVEAENLRIKQSFFNRI